MADKQQDRRKKLVDKLNSVIVKEKAIADKKARLIQDIKAIDDAAKAAAEAPKPEEKK